MTDLIFLDTEDRSEVDLLATGSNIYARDPSTKMLMTGYAIDDGPVSLWDNHPEVTPPPTAIPEALACGAKVVAHNNWFDLQVLDQNKTWPLVPSEDWIDTQAMCYYNGLPGKLDHALLALDLDLKDAKGTRLIHKFCKPRRPSMSNPDHYWEPDKAEADWKAFQKYCLTDVRQLRALYYRLRPLPPIEEEIRLATQRMNERGVPIDLDTVEAALDIIEELVPALEERVKKITGGIKTTQRDKMLVWLKERGVEPKSWGEDNVRAALPQTQNKDTIFVMKARLTLCKSSTKKLKTMQVCCNKDARVHGTLQYYGAYRTGRWAGRLLQIQNFPRGSLKAEAILRVIQYIQDRDLLSLQIEFDNPLEAISSCLRAMISAPTGKILYVADYSAIEARVLVWLAQEKKALADFHKGLDTYKIMAGVIYGKSASQVTDAERKVGKDTVLGAGFNMGWKTFMSQINNRGGAQVSAELSKASITAYRNKHKKIVKFWEAINNVAITTVITKKEHKLSCLKFTMDKGDLLVHLPSGRHLTYAQAHMAQATTSWGQKVNAIHYGVMRGKDWLLESTYGGKLTENVVQAIARDLMAFGLLSAEKAGYHPIGTIHDELISEEEIGYKSIGDYINTITIKPKWAESMGCIPLTADGFEAKRYRK